VSLIQLMRTMHDMIFVEVKFKPQILHWFILKMNY